MNKKYLSVIPFFIVGIGMVSTSSHFNGGYGIIDGMLPALLGMAVSIIGLVDAQAWVHSEMIMRKEWPNHFKASIGRGIFALAIAMLYHSRTLEWWAVTWLTTFGLSFFGLAFNYCLNMYRKKDWNYLSKGKRASIFDRIFSSFPYGWAVLMIVQAIGIFASAWAYLNNIKLSMPWK